MMQRHTALIVEDDPAAAEDLVEIVRSIGCTSVVVDNSELALLTLQSRSYCFVLLDLQIKGEADAIKGHVEHGKTFLRKVREMHGEHHGTVFRLPVVVLSGHAHEVNVAVDVMKDGASDVIQKPINNPQVSERIRRALEDSGRERHELCRDPGSPTHPKPDQRISIAIPGDRIGRRTLVMVGLTRVELTNAALKVLLHLIVSRQTGTAVNKAFLGASPEDGSKAVSRMLEQFRTALAGRHIIKNEYHGDYRFTEDVTIGQCAFDKLREIGDAEISQLVEQLQRV
ncbi:MAG: hypothetical protein QOF63_1391 [Thermoanaerobaculia bacterium]|jgi:FixJ family two-component response regulator|nr:hypothetical protein [Thermoanaerobaculia bacterium]